MHKFTQELTELFKEYLLTIDNNDTDEWYCDSLTLYSGNLADFLVWLNHRDLSSKKEKWNLKETIQLELCQGRRIDD